MSGQQKDFERIKERCLLTVCFVLSGGFFLGVAYGCWLVIKFPP